MARKVKDSKVSPKSDSKNDDAGNHKTKNKVSKTRSRTKDSLRISKSPVIEEIAKDIKTKSSESDTNVTKLKNVKNKTQKKKVVPKSKEDMQETIPKNSAQTISSEKKLDDGDSKPVSQVQKGKRKSMTKSAKEPKAPKLKVKNENDLNDVSTAVINGGNGGEGTNKIVSKTVRGRTKVVKAETGTADDAMKSTKKEPRSKAKAKAKPKKKPFELEETKVTKNGVNFNGEGNMANENESETSSTKPKKKMSSADLKKFKDSESSKNETNNDSSSDSDFEDVEENPQPFPLSNVHKRKSSDSEIDEQKKPKKQKQSARANKSVPNKTKELKPRVTKAKTKKDNSVQANTKKNNSEDNSAEAKTKTTVNTSILDETDIKSLLLRMEGAGQSSSKVGGDSSLNSSSIDSDSPEESDWEEVADHHTDSPVKSQIPTKSVEITIDHPDFLNKKRKKKAFDWKAWVERKIRRFQKDVRIGIHKVQLLCLLSHGMQQNRICDSPVLKGQALSLIPTRFLSRDISMVDSAEMKDMITWYKTVVTFNPHPDQSSRSMVTVNQLEKMFDKKEAVTEKQFVLMFLIILRVLGYDVRLVMSFQPIPLKESTGAKNKLKPPRKKIVKKSPNKTKTSDKLKPEENREKNVSKTSKNSKKKTKGKCEKTGRKRRASKNVKTYKETESESDPGSDTFVPDEDSISSDESCDKRSSAKGKSPKVKSPKGNHSSTLDEDNSSDFEEEVEFRSPVVVRKNKELKKNRKILSSDSSDDSELGCDVWIEIYLQEEHQWICVDCIREVVNKPYDIESTTTYPLHYCLAYSNDNSIKDVTPRYASDWLSTTRKLRTDSDWWRETLQTYRSQEEQNEQDDENIKDQLIKRPLPTSIAQFKNHPLYVLQRHLLKFEAIYPDTAIPVGYIRGVPIYPRECVHVLHSRENWMKEGRAVRIGEEPYKMVKSRPKWKKPKENPDALDLEIFGEWQTDIYIPPPAVDGKIPRNEYGNVELFKPCMLPGGTVHLQVSGLNRVAKKLGIDCVAAMVGWDYHGGFSHALLEGFVVCEDQKDILMAAWEEDQEIQKQREREKIEKRVLGNWKLLTRGLLIKERLQIKFDLKKEVEQEKEEVKEKKKVKKGKSEMAKDAALSWPRRQQTAAQAEKKKNQDHFEVETL